jgi:hypothetical protein
VGDTLLKRRDATEERIVYQLESERRGIFTLNEEDLYEYKAKFVSACKDKPFSSRGQPPLDPNDPAIGIMGSARGYFHGGYSVAADVDSRLTPTTVSHRRFLDSVPLAINHELIYGLIGPGRDRLEDILYERLGLNGAEAEAECDKLLREPPNVQATREELSAQYERFSAAAAALDVVIY